MNTLTTRQTELLERIARCWEEGVAPVVSELAWAMNYAGQSSVTPMLESLRRKGLIEVLGGVRGRQRQILLTPQGKALTQKPGLPVVGSIAAGPLGESLQNVHLFAEALQDVLPFESGDFLLEVKGDSMIGDGIWEGDRVLLRPNVPVSNGEIAAVHVGEEYSATLKRVFFHPGKEMLELRASNPKYEALILPAEKASVVGVFRGLVRGAPRVNSRRSVARRKPE